MNTRPVTQRKQLKLIDGTQPRPLLRQNVTDNDQRSRRRGIQSVEVGFTILEVLRKASGSAPLRTIAERAGMPVANVHNYLVSFQNVGIVVQEPDTGYYGLGPYAMRLGLAALQQFDVHRVARPILAELAAKTGRSAFLGVWGNKGATMIYRVECALRPPLMELRVGAVLPLLTSALGRNFLAHLPRQATSQMVKNELASQKRNPAAFLAADIPRSMDEVDAMIAVTRSRRFSCCKGSFLPDMITMSSPVFDHFGDMIAGVTIMGPLADVSDDPDGLDARMLKSHAALISEAAGWSVP